MRTIRCFDPPWDHMSASGLHRTSRFAVMIACVVLMGSCVTAFAADYPRITPVVSSAVRIPSAPGSADSDIRARLEGEIVEVSGISLNTRLLRRLYALHGFAPIWVHREWQAAALLNAIMRADEHGLDPNAFHAAQISRLTSLSPSDRDLLLSDAFMTYADALARGGVPMEGRERTQALTPEVVDVVAALQKAIISSDPAGSLDTLAPASPAYRRLREAYRLYRSAGATAQARQVAVNLERLRWLPRAMPPGRVEVNTANAQLQLFRQNEPVFTTRVVVGETDKQTPEFQGMIRGVVFNPSWYVPHSIAAREILPKLRADPGYLARHHMVRRDGSIVQLPGRGNALGQLKLDMPNRYNVYLHDTPIKELFTHDNRRQSHGCVRVQYPRELAALLLQHPLDWVNQAIAAGFTRREALPVPIPVFFVYQTAVAKPGGEIQFLADVYHRDLEVWNRLFGTAATHLEPPAHGPVSSDDGMRQYL